MINENESGLSHRSNLSGSSVVTTLCPVFAIATVVGEVCMVNGRNDIIGRVAVVLDQGASIIIAGELYGVWVD